MYVQWAEHSLEAFINATMSRTFLLEGSLIGGSISVGQSSFFF